MIVTNCRQYFHDLLVDLLAIKSGLAVSVPTAVHLLNSTAPEDERWWDGKPLEGVSVRAEEVQYRFIQLLHHVGAIPDDKTIEALGWDFCRGNMEHIPHDEEFPLPLPIEVLKLTYLKDAVIRTALDGAPLPAQLQSLPGIEQLVGQVALRHIWGKSTPDSRRWNGTVSLRDLFESEEAPATPGTYFDQRFIDYLLAQPQDIAWIQWRQFERLTAEYFHRQGYTIHLGAGRKDGGVDITAQKATNIVGPEFVVIQCRRYNEDSSVGLDAVRAFWATVNDQSATRGMIATTSRLTEGAKNYCEARRYRLSSAETANVIQWLEQMKTRA